MKKSFTIDNIKQFLNEIGFTWVDKLVYVNKKYRKAKLEDFDKDVLIYVQMHLNSKYLTINAHITNTEFILSINTNRIEVSGIWEEYLLNQHEKNSNIEIN